MPRPLVMGGVLMSNNVFTGRGGVAITMVTQHDVLRVKEIEAHIRKQS